MIICPICKEEIDDDSRYCDQCGQELFFCQQCGRVGVGRRCTHCGGLMVSPDGNKHAGIPTGSITGYVSTGSVGEAISQPGSVGAVPVLTLSNDSLNIRIVGMNGHYRTPSRTLYSVLFQSRLCLRCTRTVEIYSQSRMVCR